MAENVKKNLKVEWISSRIEFTATADDLERFFFGASDGQKYYIDLDKANRASELVAISLIRDAYLHDKFLNVRWQARGRGSQRRRWLKAVNIHG